MLDILGNIHLLTMNGNTMCSWWWFIWYRLDIFLTLKMKVFSYKENGQTFKSFSLLLNCWIKNYTLRINDIWEMHFLKNRLRLYLKKFEFHSLIVRQGIHVEEQTEVLLYWDNGCSGIFDLCSANTSGLNTRLQCSIL